MEICLTFRAFTVLQSRRGFFLSRLHNRSEVVSSWQCFIDHLLIARTGNSDLSLTTYPQQNQVCESLHMFKVKCTDWGISWAPKFHNLVWRIGSWALQRCRYPWAEPEGQYTEALPMLVSDQYTEALPLLVSDHEQGSELTSGVSLPIVHLF